MKKRREKPLVAVVSPGLGTEGGLVSVARALADACDHQRYEVEYFINSRDLPRLKKMVFIIKRYLQWWHFLLFRRPDLVHIHTSTRRSFTRKSLYAMPAYLLGIPVILHIHVSLFINYYFKALWPLKMFIRFIFGRASCLIFLFSRMADMFSAEFPGQHITVLPNPVDLREIEFSNSARLVRTLVYLGSFLSMKRVRNLVPLAVSLKDVYPDMKIIVCGNHGTEAFRSEIRAAGVEQFFDLRGWVGPQEKIKWLKEATSLIIPSSSEGIPVVVLESMAAGLPILATPVGGVPDIVSDGQEAIFFPPDNIEAMAQAVRKLFDNPELAPKLVAAARARVEREFTLPIIAGRLQKIYDQVLTSK